MSLFALVVGGGILLVGLALVWRGVRYYRIGTLVLDTTTENVRSASLGRTELEGEAEPAAYVLDRPFSEGQCLYADYRIRQRVDDRESSLKAYVTIFEHTVSVPFYLSDRTGRVRVDADADTRFVLSDSNSQTHSSKNDYIMKFLRKNSGLTGTIQDALSGEEEADLEAVASERRRRLTRLERRYGSFEHVPRPALNDDSTLAPDSGWSPSLPTLEGTLRWLWRVVNLTTKRSGNISESMTHRRFSERVLPVGESVYVFGGTERAASDSDIEFVLTEDPTTGMLLVSVRPDAATGRSFRRWSYVFVAAGVLVAAAGLWVALNAL